MRYFVFWLLCFSCTSSNSINVLKGIEYKLSFLQNKSLEIKTIIKNNLSQPIFFVTHPKYFIILDDNNEPIKRMVLEYKYSHNLVKITSNSEYILESPSYYKYELKKGKYRIYSVYDLIFTKTRFRSSWTNYLQNHREKYFKLELRSNTLEFEITE